MIKIIQKPESIVVNETDPAVFRIFFTGPDQVYVTVAVDGQNLDFSDGSQYYINMEKNGSNHLTTFTIFSATKNQTGFYSISLSSLHSAVRANISLRVIRTLYIVFPKRFPFLIVCDFEILCKIFIRELLKRVCRNRLIV